MKKSFMEAANNISECSKSWMNEFEYIAPSEISRRRKVGRGRKDAARTVMGLFIKPRLGSAESIYIFEGLRNKDYMSVFNPASVIVVGSHLERDYARSHGYGFCWSFPMVSATNAKIYRGWNFPITRQLGCWTEELSKFKRVFVFLYEDTQPLGIFFVFLGKLLKSKVTSICIQHGYFFRTNYPIRCEGALSDINLVWDEQQAEVIGSKRSATYVIGLPYVAKAKPTAEVAAVLVGTGMPYVGNDEYENCIEVFERISDSLSQSLGLAVLYRPHPNEWIHEDLIARLRHKFTLLDGMDKVQRLNGPRAIFIGTLSTLLYEAGVADHLVVHLQLSKNETPVFKYDCSFEPTNINELVTWVSNSIANQTPDVQPVIPDKRASLDRFVRALNAANLNVGNDIKPF